MAPLPTGGLFVAALFFIVASMGLAFAVVLFVAWTSTRLVQKKPAHFTAATAICGASGVVGFFCVLASWGCSFRCGRIKAFWICDRLLGNGYWSCDSGIRFGRKERLNNKSADFLIQLLVDRRTFDAVGVDRGCVPCCNS